MLKKIKILVPLDQPDIIGVAHKDTSIPDYKLVFEESMNLAKALYAEVVLLHVANRENKGTILPDDKRESDLLYNPEDLEDLKKTTQVAEIENLIERHLPKLELVEYAGAEVKAWKEGEGLEFEVTDATMAGLDDLFISGDLEDRLHSWSIRLTSQLQEPIQNLLVKSKDLLARAGDEPNNARATILMMDIQGRVICKAAQAWGMDLIVMGRGKAPGWHSILFDSMSLWFDSASTYVLHNAPCSFFLVDEHLKKVQKIDKILVALDHSSTSREVFDQAVNIAERIRAAKKSLNPNITDEDATPTLCLLHVISPFEQDDPQLLPSFVAQAQERNVPVQSVEKPAPKVREHFTESMLQPDALPGQVICEMATEWGADLVMLGYRREWELKKLVLGSVCNYVTRHAPCSVFVVRAFNPLDIELSTSDIERTHIEPAKEERVALPTNS